MEAHLSHQARLYYTLVPDKNKWKLDKQIDFEHSGMPEHRGEIADAMDEWEGSVATKLGLTMVDVSSVKIKHRDDLNLQV